jgi:cellulose biosynthesis protein BcsQ
MISIAMFNNKGGVGKTTLTCNIASFFANRFKKRVIVVDCDPQCNSTQLIMGEEFSTDLYWNKDSQNQVTTIRDVLQPIEDGDSQISTSITPIISSRNRFNVDLLPGHPSFSIIEDRLGAAWHDLRGGDIGGIRKTNWNTSFCSSIHGKYDFAFFDLGPSLGSINRSVLIGCDRFITPMGADIFSILGIKNIATWIEDWAKIYNKGLESAIADRLKEYPVNHELSIMTGYLGYTMQQYITKSKQGERRPTKAYESIIMSVPKIIEESIGRFRCKNIKPDDVKLGDVPHLYSLIPLAQSVAAPILGLQASDGLVGAQYKQREDYGGIIEQVCQKIGRNLQEEV